MKRLIAFLSACVLMSVASPLRAAETPEQVTTLQVTGMIPGSAPKVEEMLSKLPGVVRVKASDQMGAVVVIYDASKVKADEFTAAMQRAGYLAMFAKANYRCPHCQAVYHKDGMCLICNVPLEQVATS